jgi:pimeloyl-ACP methyl ester carboxylesterase
MQIQRIELDNGHGWTLDLKRFSDPATLDPQRRPIVMVPGYAMNTFILSYHPGGTSMVEYLVQGGFEVWTANLRGQGDSRRVAPARRYGLKELALHDVPRVLDHVRASTATNADLIDVVGCSLGASFLYTYLAHHRPDHGVGSMVSIGGPLRWDEAHPVMKVAFRSGRLAGALPVRNTRQLARLALPLVKRAPALLSIYMNAGLIDLGRADEILNTIDDPVPWINRQVARWLRDKDLTVEGLNITEGLAGLDLPILCILANADGIVPPATALSVQRAVAPGAVTVLEVGDSDRWFAHADLFVADTAQEQVFEPMRQWLADRY